jgi:hypothetical protein
MPTRLGDDFVNRMVEQLEVIRAAVQLEPAGQGPIAQLCASAQ